ncbi:MAG: hypothetical protein E2594_06860 [Pseudomonas sp.]|nr:hypothetical protein [Pseudomonas sp.]TRO36407.1 hypothetical protein EQ845_10900 [Pseudomonas putida]
MYYALQRVREMCMSNNSRESDFKICYLKGVRLKAKEKTHKDDPDRESLEHIIPNALGGKLTSEEILSHSGNQQLNDEIDKDFVKIFASFSSRLDIHKDRRSSPSMRAFHLDHEQKVIYKNGKYFPVVPFYDKGSKTIYANSVSNANNYRRHLVNVGDISEEDEVRLADDMAGNIEAPFGFDNDNFKRGLAKIAVGYAVLNGIAREQLTAALDLQNKTFAKKILLVPSLPTSQGEAFIEENIESSPHYPCHTLTLCGHEGILYCHVELFNAFQWYVVLSENYQGADIYRAYTYDILNNEEISRSSYILSVDPTKDALELAKHRRLARAHLEHMAYVLSTDIAKVRGYNHFKFKQLSGFTNRYFVYNKAIALGLISEETPQL